MSELEPLNLHEIPGIHRLNINDVMFQTPLNSDRADILVEAVDTADSIAGEVLELVENVSTIADRIVDSMSLEQFKEIEGELDELCNLRDQLDKELNTANDVSSELDALTADDDSQSEVGEETCEAVEVSVSEVNSLLDAIEMNIESIANFIDQ